MGYDTSIRLATMADRRALATTLASAFVDDPVWVWMIPPRRREARLQLLFGALLRNAIPRGHIYTVGDATAVAIWAPPGEWEMPKTAIARAAVPIARAASSRLPRLLGRLNQIEAVHRRQPDSHWYLEYIGTRQEARGTGLGSALLSDALARTDAEGTPVYLESSNSRNLPFYERHGFTVTEQLDLAAGPPQWLLWRDRSATPG